MKKYISIYFFVLFTVSFAQAQNQFSLDAGIGLAKGFDFPEREKGVPMQEQKYSTYFASAGWQSDIGVNYIKNKKHQFRFGYSYREHQYEYALGDYNLGGSKLVFSLNLYDLSYKYGWLKASNKHQIWTGISFYKEQVREKRLFTKDEPSVLIDKNKNNFYPKNSFGNSFLIMYEFHITKNFSVGLQSQMYYQWKTNNFTHLSILPKAMIYF